MELNDYSESTQKFFIEFLLSSNDAFMKSQNIIKPEYFDKKFKPAVRFVKDYSKDYNAIPGIRQVEVQTGLEFEPVENIKDQDINWFLDSIESFCRHKAIENVILNSPDKLQNKKYGELEREIQEAVLVSLEKNLGTNYFENPKERLMRLKDNNGSITTGWKTLDNKLYGGYNRGELNIFLGASGAGKSLFLQNTALIWSMLGYDVVYFTHELSEDLVSLRFDAMVSGYPTKSIYRNLEDVDMAVRYKSKQWGNIMIKYMDTGHCVNDLKAYLKEYEIQTGKLPDGIVVDYLDLLHPNDRRINPSDLYIKDKFVSEELRSLANEINATCVSASQINRSGAEEREHDHTHIAGGISKIQTADNIFSIYTSASMRQRGEYILNLLKTRSSAGVGDTIELAYNNETMRIMDKDEDDESQKPKIKDNESVTKELKQKKEEEQSGSSKESTSQIRSILDKVHNRE